jgi:hypothetical protein
MSDNEIRVWLCACLLLIVGLGVAVGYLLGMVSFLVERVGRTEVRVSDDAVAIDALTKALRHTNRVIDKYMPGGVE